MSFFNIYDSIDQSFESVLVRNTADFVIIIMHKVRRYNLKLHFKCFLNGNYGFICDK